MVMATRSDNGSGPTRKFGMMPYTVPELVGEPTR